MTTIKTTEEIHTDAEYIKKKWLSLDESLDLYAFAKERIGVDKMWSMPSEDLLKRIEEELKK